MFLFGLFFAVCHPYIIVHVHFVETFFVTCLCHFLWEGGISFLSNDDVVCGESCCGGCLIV